MGNVEANTDVAVGQDRTVFYNRFIVDFRVAFNVAASGNEAFLLDPRPAPEEGRGDYSRLTVYASALGNPDSRTCFGAHWMCTATRTEDIDRQAAQISWVSQEVYVATKCIASWIGRSQIAAQILGLRGTTGVHNPEL